MSKLNNEFVKGVLRTDGVRFVNEDGQEIILNGWGTANWENTEGFMIGSAPLPQNLFKWILFPGPGNDHNPERWTSRRFVSQMVRELCGAKYESTFWERWEENHLREEDIKLMADLGFNCVRIVLNANALLYEEPGFQWNEGGFSRLAKIIDACEKYRVYAILDMHGVIGGNNGATGDSLFCEYPLFSLMKSLPSARSFSGKRSSAASAAAGLSQATTSSTSLYLPRSSTSISRFLRSIMKTASPASASSTSSTSSSLKARSTRVTSGFSTISMIRNAITGQFRSICTALLRRSRIFIPGS